MAAFVNYRKSNQVVLRNIRRDFFFILIGRNADDVGVHDVAQTRVIMRQNQRAHGHDTNELFAVFLKHIHVVNRGEIFVQMTKRLDCLAHRIVFAQSHETRGHHAARGVFAISEQAANLSGIFHAHKTQQGLGLLIGKIADDVGRVVRIHLTEQTGDFAIFHVVKRLSLEFVPYLQLSLIHI